MDSVFTRIIKRELPARIIWENDNFISFLPNGHFVNKGHTLLVPKKQVDYVFDLEDDLYAEMWIHAKILAEPLKKITGAKRIGIAVEGFSVPHVHIHLCPVNNVAELDPHRKQEWPEEERDSFVHKMIRELGEIA